MLPVTFCVNDGVNVNVDEDGCCVTCGCDAMLSSQAMQSLIQAIDMPHRESLRNLVTKLDAMVEPLNAACMIAHIHGMPYIGPMWTDELNAAKALLKAEVVVEKV